jgi:hypothetical protein
MVAGPYGTCENCLTEDVSLKYAGHTMCCRYACQKAAKRLVSEQHAALAAAKEPETEHLFCFEVDEVLGVREADPKELTKRQRRGELEATDIDICYLVRGRFGEDEDDPGMIDTQYVSLSELVTNIKKEKLDTELDTFARGLAARMKDARKKARTQQKKQKQH